MLFILGDQRLVEDGEISGTTQHQHVNEHVETAEEGLTQELLGGCVWGREVIVASRKGGTE